MTFASTLTSKNQTTIPKEVVRFLKLKPSSRLIFEVVDGKVMITAKTKTFSELVGLFPHKAQKSATLEEMQKAIKEGAVESSGGISKK